MHLRSGGAVQHEHPAPTNRISARLSRSHLACGACDTNRAHTTLALTFRMYTERLRASSPPAGLPPPREVPRLAPMPPRPPAEPAPLLVVAMVDIASVSSERPLEPPSNKRPRTALAKMQARRTAEDAAQTQRRVNKLHVGGSAVGAEGKAPAQQRLTSLPSVSEFA